MKPPTEEQVASEIIDLFADLFGSSPKAVCVREAGASDGYDYLISVPDHRFLVEYKRSASLGPMTSAIDQLKRSSEGLRDNGLPLILVPYMGKLGRELCEKSGVSWLDLCGNAQIVAPGLRIRIEGRPNRYLDRGRPPNVFATKSSRIARQLLLQPRRFQTQAELARQTGLDDGYVSKIVRRLLQENLIEGNDVGALRAHDPDMLLDAWRHL